MTGSPTELLERLLDNPATKSQTDKAKEDGKGTEDESCPGFSDRCYDQAYHGKYDVEPIDPSQEWDESHHHSQSR